MAILCLDVAVPTAQKLDLTEHTGSKRGLSCLGVSLEPNDAELVVARKVPVTDCRVVRGFLGTPVDGSVHSWDYRGQTREYPNTASDGVVYSYNNNDGLHITLADEPGFDLVVLRGGAQTKMYSDTKSLAEPADGQLLCEFEGTRQNTTVCFSKRVRAHKVSFFGTKSGTIADASFYRIEKKGFTGQRAELWAPGDGSVAIRKPDSQFAPESLYLAMKERYPAAEHRSLPLLQARDQLSSPVECRANQAIHFITPPFYEEKGLASITLVARMTGPSGPFSFTTVVQDPLDPRLDIFLVDFHAAGPGNFYIELDIPDQVLIKNSRLWLTLRFDSNVRLSGLQGDAPQFVLSFVSRDKALPEALARRKLLMKSFFSLLSEPRPWGAYTRRSRERFYASSRYARQCPELFMTIDQCHTLDPEDDTVRQYREWVYLLNLDELSQVSAPPTPPKGVPTWAWYPRLALLEVRRIANWWLDERLVPTGEFGGRVGDDSDFYQQFADLPFFETGGVAARLKDSAARMAELADEQNLRGGINIHATDSLHAYEEGINHLALMARWFYGDPIYLERCMESAHNMEKLTTLTKDGRRHFRDRDRMGAEDIKQPRKPNVDGHANPLMWHTALQVADYNRNPRALKTLRQWADTWLRHMKPGRWATDVEVVSGKVTGFQKNRPLYGGYRSQATTFTWIYGLTHDERYLEPFLYYYKRGQAPLPANVFLADAYTLGALNRLQRSTLVKLAAHSPALYLYLSKDPNPLVQATIGNPRSRHQEIATLFDAFRWPDMYTTTHQFTDRIFPSLLQRASVSYLGGFCRRNKFNPTLAASWEGLGTDYATLVLDNKPNRMEVLVYSFANRPMKGNMRIWALEHGIYQLTIGPDSDSDHKMDRVKRRESLELAKADKIELTLPPRLVTVISVEQLRKLDPIFGRADLAIAAREVQINANTLTGVIHNIGSADVTNVTVAVVDAAGRTIAHESLGKIPAPVDLIPKQLPFTIQLPYEPKKGSKLVLDPEHRIPEIYEGNNEVMVDSLPAVDYSKGWE